MFNAQMCLHVFFILFFLYDLVYMFIVLFCNIVLCLYSNMFEHVSCVSIGLLTLDHTYGSHMRAYIRIILCFNGSHIRAQHGKGSYLVHTCKKVAMGYKMATDHTYMHEYGYVIYTRLVAEQGSYKHKNGHGTQNGNGSYKHKNGYGS